MPHPHPFSPLHDVVGCSCDIASTSRCSDDEITGIEIVEATQIRPACRSKCLANDCDDDDEVEREDGINIAGLAEL
jgi:hypothetical protein